jgi:hypothetical protein
MDADAVCWSQALVQQGHVAGFGWVVGLQIEQFA